jgi:hypothetical protein
MAGTWWYEGSPLPLPDFRQIEGEVATSARPKQQEVLRILNRLAFTVEASGKRQRGETVRGQDTADFEGAPEESGEHCT